MTTDTAAPETPAGFRKDRHGNLIAEANIKPVDLAMDKLATKLVTAAMGQRETIQDFKIQGFRDVYDFMEKMAKRHNVTFRGKKGNLTLTSFDGRYVVKLRSDDKMAFGPQLELARSLISDYLDEVSEGASSDLRNIVMTAFSVGDGKANVSHTNIIQLFKHRITHPKWVRAMNLIKEAQRVEETKKYLLFYERDENGQEWPISLNYANL